MKRFSGEVGPDLEVQSHQLIFVKLKSPKFRVTTTLENRENRENEGNLSGLENSGKTQGILSVLREFLFLRFFKIIKKNC